MLRAMLAKVPGFGGLITLLPLAKQPNCSSWLARAWAAQAARTRAGNLGRKFRIPAHVLLQLGV